MEKPLIIGVSEKMCKRGGWKGSKQIESGENYLNILICEQCCSGDILL